jgi:beta-glucosidase
MSLPTHVDAMIEQVLEARPDTAVVVQSGMPVAMPWADKAKSAVQMWFGGNEGGSGLADIVFGDVNPVSKALLYANNRILTYVSER